MLTFHCSSSNIAGLSNGTFLGLSALTALHLSHNQIERIEAEQVAGLESLELLYLDHNKLHWLSSALFSTLTRLVVVTLNNNQLTQLDGLQAGLQSVSLHHNRWECASQQDCHWITQALHTFNRSAVRYLNQVTCLDQDDQHQNLLGFMSSCTNLDVLPVSAQTSTPPFLVIVISVAVVVLLMVFAIISFLLLRGRRKARRHEGARVYLHYSSQDEELVRGEVGREVGRVVSGLCYHHTDLSTQLSVGQAISAAVSRTAALVITATPAYTESAITSAELHIIADCVLQQSNYPVIVVSPGQSQLYLEQVRGREE